MLNWFPWRRCWWLFVFIVLNASLGRCWVMISNVGIRFISFVVIGFVIIGFIVIGFGFSTLLKIIIVVGTLLPTAISCLPSGKLSG